MKVGKNAKVPSGVSFECLILKLWSSASEVHIIY